jgi:Na+-translocating ferredoxin:NAD+ oxidoreductase RnfE subunit
MVSGLSEAARYEFMNSSRPGIARSYWDAFGVGLMLAVVLIVIGSLWSLVTGIRARRAEAEQG